LTRPASLLVLLLAAALEAAGDALLRNGLHSHSLPIRVLLFLAGAAALFLYGLTVNTPPWDFGRVIGLYIVFFFIVAQLISWLVFKQPPTTPLLLGGSLIVAGGIVLSLAR